LTGYLNTAREMHTATLLPNGKVMVAGGTTFTRPKYLKLTSCELYDPASGAWSKTASMSTARTEHTATLLPSGKTLAAGGVGTFTIVSAAELYSQ
jgi:hypothetical protein